MTALPPCCHALQCGVHAKEYRGGTNLTGPPDTASSLPRLCVGSGDRVTRNTPTDATRHHMQHIPGDPPPPNGTKHVPHLLSKGGQVYGMTSGGVPGNGNEPGKPLGALRALKTCRKPW